jgi:hypothetical protein
MIRYLTYSKVEITNISESTGKDIPTIPLRALFEGRDNNLAHELTPNLRPLRAAFRKSDQISKQNTSATHFYTYNLPRNQNLIPSQHSQRQTFAKREG